MATEHEILASRRARAERLRERGVELFPARVPRDRTPIPEILARFGKSARRSRPGRAGIDLMHEEAGAEAR